MDGVTAAVHNVALTLEGDFLVGRTVPAAPDELGPPAAAELLRWAPARVSPQQLGDGRVQLVCAEQPDAMLIVSREAAAALLASVGVDVRRRGPRPRWQNVLIYGAGSVAVAALLYASATPAARWAAHRVPRSAEAKLGQELAHLVSKKYCETPEAGVALGQLARRLGADPHIAVHVLDLEMVNAFTFPGGTVVITKGLLAEAAGPDEVAGVLAHEIEHVARRHVMVHVVRSSLLTALWQAGVGDYTGFFVIDPKTAFDIAALRFSRDDEREADRGAVARLQGAGIRPDGFRQFFDRLRAKTDSIPPWLSNHPSSAERMAAIAAGQPTAQGTTLPALGEAEWKSLQQGCGPRL
jgi:Zn-dependent protease with chaperone function